MELIETSTFTRQIIALLRDEEYGNFNPASPPTRNSALVSKVEVEYARLALPLDRGERGAALASSTTGGKRGRDSAALCVREERSGGSDSETNFAARQGRQRGIRY